MKKYFFIFGLHPTLSAAELLAYLHREKISYSWEDGGTDFIILSSQSDWPLAEMQKSLGGIVKMGKIWKSFTNNLDNKLVAKSLLDFVVDNKKIFFGFSFYPATQAPNQKKVLKEIGLPIKKMLQPDTSVRLVMSKNSNLSSVVVAKNKLLSERGAELVYLTGGNKKYMGRTEVVQDFAAYSRRDYNRPQRDDKSGLIPPKLAQMMINLSQLDKDSILSDPFCGSGTIVQEAACLGYQHIIGSDLSAQAVQSARLNMDWLKEKTSISSQIDFYQLDAANLSKKIPVSSVGAVVTEPDLGSSSLSLSNVMKEKKRLQNLYKLVFFEFAKILIPQGRVVMVWPVFFDKYYIELPENVFKGWRLISPLPKEYLSLYPLGQRGFLHYGRVGQKVSREIVIWQKK